MPLYDFLCPRCQKPFERRASHDTDRTPCPYCGSESKRLLSRSFATHYKGSGFYTTDYKKKNEPDQS